jgi:hypothetical protein
MAVFYSANLSYISNTLDCDKRGHLLKKIKTKIAQAYTKESIKTVCAWTKRIQPRFNVYFLFSLMFFIL